MKFGTRVIARETPKTAAFLDVLFILLITFFLVTSLTADDSDQHESKVEVRLPQLDAEGAKAASASSDALQIVLFEDGRMAVQETMLGAGSVGLEALERVLALRREQKGALAARIYTDEGARAEHFLPLLALLREQGWEQIDLLGRAAERPEVQR